MKKKPCFTNSNEPVFSSPGFSLDFLPCYRANETCPIHIVGTSKDLMLCCESKFSLRVVYYICNPLTKHWVALPPAPQSHRKELKEYKKGGKWRCEYCVFISTTSGSGLVQHAAKNN
ncbi:F-box protein [Quillaja saponaria]|uniref:F-box protein n=1 Tax=Quillaja saponaria TaxID=32244 RepID=A0AAD7PG36_QUISA|nr:F-box protein [Quillaja saponaria]